MRTRLLSVMGSTLASVELEYVDLPGDVDVTPLRPFDAVAVSSFSARIREAYRLADRYRAAGTRVILGGLHVTAMPHEAMRHADAVVLGEGEPLWPAVVGDLLSGKLQRVYDARRIAFDLADAPMPRFDLLDIECYNRLTVQTQRGCPFRCEFYGASVLLTPTYKLKPVEKVMAEVRHIKALWPDPFIEFADDNGLVSRRHSKALLRELSGAQVRWFTETDISVAEDVELLALMRDSGCAQVLVGLQSPSRAGLDGLELASNWKLRQHDRYLESIRRMQEHRITVNGCFVLGLDGAGPESFEDVWRFVRDSGLYEVQVTVLTPFPGTPLYARLREQGRLLREEAWELCTLFDVNFRPAAMSVAELQTGFRDLVERLYAADFTRERRANYRRRVRAARLSGPT